LSRLAVQPEDIRAVATSLAATALWVGAAWTARRLFAALKHPRLVLGILLALAPVAGGGTYVTWTYFENRRAVEANRLYDDYSTAYREAVMQFADARLESIFEAALGELESRKVPVSQLGNDSVPDALVTGILAQHRGVIEEVIFLRFNAEVVDALRALPDKRDYPPWMRRAIREWTHQRYKGSMLVENSITGLIESDAQVGQWVRAYYNRDRSSEWKDLTRNRILEKLGDTVGAALGEGRDQVEALVRAHFPSMSGESAIPE
jgi:hypothetical protein